jgi:phytoene dehydrogenase-like protein
MILGGGHNGLVAAHYLKRRGWNVTIVESAAKVGGVCITEEFYPGFRNSVASYAVSLLQPTIINDMRLTQHGLTLMTRPGGIMAPSADNTLYLQMAEEEGITEQSIAQFSSRDAEAYPRYAAMLADVADCVSKLMMLSQPSGLDLPILSRRTWFDVASLIQSGQALRELTLEQRRDLLNLFSLSAGELLDQWFESDLLKGVLAFDAITGHYASM